jgi:hypothetical protein
MVGHEVKTLILRYSNHHISLLVLDSRAAVTWRPGHQALAIMYPAAV